MKTKAIMTADLLTVPTGTELFKAYDIMKVNSIRHLPVVGEDKLVIGIISDRDLQRAMIITENGTFDQTFRFKEGDRVEHYMSWPVISVSEESEIASVANLMLKHKISSLLITSESGQVRGIVTVDDILRYVAASPEPQQLKIIDLFSRTSANFQSAENC